MLENRRLIIQIRMYYAPDACLQVLYTMPSKDSSDADAALISESGAMNVFFLLDKVGKHLLSAFNKRLSASLYLGQNRDAVCQKVHRAANDMPDCAADVAFQQHICR